MKISQHAIDTLIKPFEGLKLKAYQDGVGILTIGFGHTYGVKAGDVITEEQAELLLEADLTEAERQVNYYVRVPLTQNEFDAMVSLIFNVGPGVPGKRDGIVWLKNGLPSTLLRVLNAHDYSGCANEFPKWSHEGTTISVGLLRRRKAEQALFLTPDLPAAA